MATEIKVPALGESVTEATISKWFKKEGDAVKRDEPLCELETDKVTVEVPSPVAGKLTKIMAPAGATVQVGATIAMVEAGAAAEAPAPAPQPARAAATQPAPAAAPAAAPQPAPAPAPHTTLDMPLPPSVRRIAQESGIDPNAISGTGRNGQLTKGDALNALEQRASARALQTAAPKPPAGPRPFADREVRTPMSRLRKTIALRLKDAQNTAAMLTTFNEVDMGPVMDLRNEYKDVFEKKHGVRLGFMGFFVKACLVALKEIPAVNGEIEGDDVIVKNYYNIGVAVATEKGLVVPVIRDADRLTLAEIENRINDFGKRARDGQLKLDELQGGTFSISNGGVFGSLMSTPILNAPQSGILGMHKIQQRPMVIDGQVKARPMMYLALSYDHRLVDGREAVTFLVRVKETLESPQRMLLDL